MDALGDIGVFVRVVEQRSFTRAGRTLALTASGVSRAVSRLEARLGVRLLDRTTRSIGLTTDGAAYYERCTRVLRELAEAEGALAQKRGIVAGLLRVDAPTVLARYVVAPAIHRFLAAHPGLSLELTSRDHLIDPIAEGVDVVLRMAALRDSELVHKRLGAMHFLAVASAQYLAQNGRPKTPADLREHQTFGFLAGPMPIPWRFRTNGRELSVQPSGRLHSNSVDALLQAARAGLGICQILAAHVEHEVQRGQLEVILDDHELPPLDIHALYAREKAHLPKVRAFLEFMQRELRKHQRA